jgi:predicted DNA-binding transcriptional regulator YafY
LTKQLSKQYEAMGIPIAGAGSVQASRAATPGAINQSLLRTPEQMTALRKSQAELKGLENTNRAKEIAIHTEIKKFGYMDKQEQDRIANISAQIANTQASTQVRLQALKTAREFDAPKARAAIDASVASSIASRSSKDIKRWYIR